MHLYFSYGSNMSRERLELRTGAVQTHGRALLRDYQHSFTHRGSDGSGKGNIGPASGMQVHGVLYGLTAEQVDLLHPYENGYQVIEVSVALLESDEFASAYTYSNLEPSHGLTPLESYIEHYMRGMLENRFPEHYIEHIRKQAGL